MKTNTCRTILLLAFCFLFAAPAIGLTNNVLNLPRRGKTEGGNKSPARASNVNDSRGGEEGTQANDNKLKRQIADRLKNQGIRGVETSVNHGVVTFTGDDPVQVNRAEEIAQTMTGNKPGSTPAANANSRTTDMGVQNGNSQSNAKIPPKSEGELDPNRDPEGGSSFWDILKWTFSIIGTLFAIGLLGYAMWTYVRSNRARLDGYFRGVKKRQDDFSTRLDTSMVTLKKEINDRLNMMSEEIRGLSTILKSDHREILDGVRQSSASAYAGFADQAAIQKQSVHTFPVSADEYLGKVKRGGMVVKPDFQNGILVQDPDGKGELLLVQDYDTAPGGLFYVVPQVGYFQTKQDFFNYYEKYYDCPRPTSGDVWIVEPAVVDKVSGGWELREKGELEIK
ncbi:MAG: hypothetical protein QOJ64_1698 [Acidobacteriota bacterium]|nr:hypothetical protein [Acidobacteriota bacterium]